jgi:2-oxoglutarate ferredoxin oxidoreductase subunit beta
MTGGQASATTLLNQITTTTPFGRKVETNGYPVKISEMLTCCEGAAFGCTCFSDFTAEIRKAKQAIKKAFEVQIRGWDMGLSRF